MHIIVQYVIIINKEDTKLKSLNRDVGIEGNSGSDGKGEWSGMVQACVEMR